MMMSRSLRRAVPFAILAVGLAGCATQGADKASGTKPAANPAKPSSAEYGKMKPIPNPQEPNAPIGKSAGSATAPRAGAVPRTAKPAASTTVPPASKSANAARAAQLRAQGLEQMNRGSIDGALALLRQASALDPSNALIKRDLERATRISRAVRATPGG